MLFAVRFLGNGVLRSVLSSDAVSEVAGFHYESGLERSQIEIAAVLPYFAYYGRRRTRYSGL